MESVPDLTQNIKKKKKFQSPKKTHKSPGAIKPYENLVLPSALVIKLDKLVPLLFELLFLVCLIT